MRELRIIWGGRTIILLDTNSPCRPFVTTMKAMQFNENFQNHYCLVFDLNSLQDAAEQSHYPELSAQSLRLELFFQFPLEQVTEVIVLGERLSNVLFDKLGTVAKMFIFFEFSGSFINIVFLGLFFVIVSVLSLLLFFRPKSPEKADYECFLIENPRKFFNLDCKPVFINFRPVHRFCVWDFVDSIPKCR